jgi:hypothetical protein
MRLSPSAMAGVYRLLTSEVLRYTGKQLPAQDELELQDIELYTQISSLPDVDLHYSILLTDDHLKNVPDGGESDRKAIYDGVMKLSEEISLYIEVKPSGKDVRDDQQMTGLIKSKVDGNNQRKNNVEGEVTNVRFRDLISVLQRVGDSPLCNWSEKLLINDFFHYVNTYYPQLNPFSDFKMCITPQLADRRIELLLQKIATTADLVDYHAKWGQFIWVKDIPEIFKLGLLVNHSSESKVGWDSITIAADFGSTQGQARDFYRNASSVLPKLKGLKGGGFNLTGNLHLAMAASNKIWFATSDEKFETYLNYWASNNNKNDKIRQVKKSNFKEYLLSLIERDVITDMSNFDEIIRGAAYKRLNVCPAVYVTYTVSREEALEYDKDGKLAEFILHKMQNILSVVTDDHSHVLLKNPR